MTHKNLLDAWDEAADALEGDPMRPIRYGKCFRYLRDMDRDSKLLELGCGEGTGLLMAKQLGFEKIVGTEISRERLKSAKDKFGNEAKLILVGPDGRLPFGDESFDIVLSAAVIEHTLDPKGFIQEIVRVVRPNGYVIISSDCYQWRILQFLGIYRSLQPIDSAIFPIRLFRIFDEGGLQLVHCEGFSLPGQEFRFVRSIATSALKQPIIRWAVRALGRLTNRRVAIPKFDLPKKKLSQQSGLAYLGDLGGPTSEPRTSKPIVWSFFKLLFSDENVFFLIKQDEHLKGY